MISKFDVIEIFKKKIREIKYHNNLYFNNDNPEISDIEYDNLKKILISFENKHSFLKDLKLLDKLVGSPPKNKFKKIKHLSPMLSLSNAFNKMIWRIFLKK